MNVTRFSGIIRSNLKLLPRRQYKQYYYYSIKTPKMVQVSQHGEDHHIPDKHKRDK